MTRERLEEIRTAIDALRDENGRIEPKGIVEAAKNKRHTLHREFIWDDAEAAQVQREDRARQQLSGEQPCASLSAI
jgi:hypothetical protein